MRTLSPARLTWLLASLLFCSLSHSLQAQLLVDLKLPRNTFVQAEPIPATLTLTNRSGKDLVLGNTNGRSWLDFTIYDGRGALVSPARGVDSAPPIVLASGQTLDQQVIINQRYPMHMQGRYRVQARVSFPQIGSVFQSRNLSLNVTEGQPMWKQVVGVPVGHPQAGSYREFQLMTLYEGARQRILYFSVKDNRSGQVIRTVALGSYLSVRPPTFFLDQKNRLHVLHLSAPSRHSYHVLDIDGRPVISETRYEKRGNRPTLKTNDFGEVTMVGGITEEEARTPYEQKEFRSISERPPGLPRF